MERKYVRFVERAGQELPVTRYNRGHVNQVVEVM
jgi:hypothetical protein